MIAEVCTRLRALDLRKCKSISDVTVSTIAENVTGLTTLKLDGNQQVDLTEEFEYHVMLRI